MSRSTKILSNLLAGVDCQIRYECQEIQIESVVSDSRKVEKGSLFVAIFGDFSDGHNYVEQAIERGCAAVLVEEGRFYESKNRTIPIIETKNTREALALLSAAMLDHPADQLQLIGVTGTNGKTTITYLLEEIVKCAGGNPGVIGTVNYRYNGQEFAAPFTTPEPIILHNMLQEMLEGGVTHVIMEVSSHALAQKRVFGLKFQVALFTNLSRDHLDYHVDMEEYYQVKKRLFTDNLTSNGRAVIYCEQSMGADSSDVHWGQRLAAEIVETNGAAGSEKLFSMPITCGFGDENDIQALGPNYTLQGTKVGVILPHGEIKIETILVGEFNLKNVLGAAGAACALGYSTKQIEKGLNDLKCVPGRLERVFPDSGVSAYVDYAHTPDALENVLSVLAKLSVGKLIVVFGCGGDRDQGKRPLMGQVAGRLAQLVIITSDNSRSEAATQIMAEIAAGVAETGMENVSLRTCSIGSLPVGYVCVAERHEAIKLAIGLAGEQDTVLVAGKGHENYQIEKGVSRFFYDRQEVRDQLTQRRENVHGNR